MAKPTQHPSGKPVHDTRPKSRSWPNTIRDEPLTPGLRRINQTYAVGFRAHLTSEDDETED